MNEIGPYLVFYPFQVLAAMAGLALIGGMLMAVSDRLALWITTGRRGLYLWIGLSLGIALYTTYDPPSDPNPWDCVTTREGERC